jgi:serine/threonine protein kinase
LHIEFVGKLPTAKTEKEKREQRSLEAMICPVAHPGVIKFWALHPQTMEAYTLWWNGQNLSKFWHINSKASEAASESSIRSNPAIAAEDTWRIIAYRKNRAKLAWALMCIMERIHKAKLLHNDIGPANIMLHFPPDKQEEVYIGVCDWGLASRMVESEASRYGYETREALERVRAARPFAAPELFYTFGPPNSDTALHRMQQQHPFTELADSFSVGSVAEQIWRGESDNDLFKGPIGWNAFHAKIRALKEVDVQKRTTISKVVEDLTGGIYNFEIPKSCYRHTI